MITLQEATVALSSSINQHLQLTNNLVGGALYGKLYFMTVDGELSKEPQANEFHVRYDGPDWTLFSQSASLWEFEITVDVLCFAATIAHDNLYGIEQLTGLVAQALSKRITISDAAGNILVCPNLIDKIQIHRYGIWSKAIALNQASVIAKFRGILNATN